jgi:CHAD domain-containing protein
MRLDPELLDGPPAAGARVMALARCADVEAAAARVADPADREALHDLRVALRRLRATLQALAPLLGDAVRPKQARRLRRAARVTGPARDAEVLLGWLHGVRGQLQPAWRGALDWLAERVERTRARAIEEIGEAALPRLEKALPRLSRRLARPAPAEPAGRAPAGGAATLAAALAPLLRVRAAALREALRDAAGGETALHRARLEGKRLRYLLEPLRGVAGLPADEAVAALKGLQDLLGEWHDAYLAGQALHASVTEAAADRARWRERGLEDADFRPGLLGLERLAAARGAASRARLEAEHLGPRATPLIDLAYAVVAALEARGAGQEAPPPARRLLLTALPAEVAGGSVEEVEQGWLPAVRPPDRLGLVRGPGGERRFRARGAAAEEPLGRADFEALWPLTEGRRLAHRSHRGAAGPGWRFDEYLDRRLVLAVAEAEGASAPDWLEPLVVRDVTAERGYADEALARRPARRAPGGAAPGKID